MSEWGNRKMDDVLPLLGLFKCLVYFRAGGTSVQLPCAICAVKADKHFNRLKASIAPLIDHHSS